MTWQLALNTFMTGLAGIGVWFLYDLIREFKTFKESTRTDVSTLKNERHTFQNTVRSAELTISSKVNDIQKIHSTFAFDVKESLLKINNELTQLSFKINGASKKAENFEEFLKKCLIITKNLNEKVKKQEHEIKRINEIMIFKTRR